jgi:hypothetical protein
MELLDLRRLRNVDTVNMASLIGTRATGGGMKDLANIILMLKYLNAHSVHTTLQMTATS